MGKRRGRGRSGTQRQTVWRGVQFENIAVPAATDTFLVIVQQSDVEKYGKVTVVNIKGGMTFHNTDSDAAGGVVRVGAKILKWRVDDAANITDDVSGRDTDQEDIEQRQLWTYMDFFRASSANLVVNRRVEISLKAMIVLGAEKEELGIVMTSSVVNRIRVTGYVRALCLLG